MYLSRDYEKYTVIKRKYPVVTGLFYYIFNEFIMCIHSILRERKTIKRIILYTVELFNFVRANFRVLWVLCIFVGM